MELIPRLEMVGSKVTGKKRDHDRHVEPSLHPEDIDPRLMTSPEFMNMLGLTPYGRGPLNFDRFPQTFNPGYDFDNQSMAGSNQPLNGRRKERRHKLARNAVIGLLLMGLAGCIVAIGFLAADRNSNRGVAATAAAEISTEELAKVLASRGLAVRNFSEAEPGYSLVPVQHQATPAPLETQPPSLPATQPQPSVVTQPPASIRQSPPTVVQSPPPIVQTPPSVIQPPLPLVQPPTPVVQSPPPVVQNPPPVVQSPPPIVQTPPPVRPTPPSVVQPPPPIVQTPPPVVQPTPPVVQTPPTVVPPTSPVVPPTSPVVPPTPPVAQPTPTVVQTPPPVVPPTSPAAQPTPPVVQTPPPVVPPTPPVAQPTPPVVQLTPPTSITPSNTSKPPPPPLAPAPQPTSSTTQPTITSTPPTLQPTTQAPPPLPSPIQTTISTTTPKLQPTPAPTVNQPPPPPTPTINPPPPPTPTINQPPPLAPTSNKLKIQVRPLVLSNTSVIGCLYNDTEPPDVLFILRLDSLDNPKPMAIFAKNSPPVLNETLEPLYYAANQNLNSAVKIYALQIRRVRCVDAKPYSCFVPTPPDAPMMVAEANSTLTLPPNVQNPVVPAKIVIGQNTTMSCSSVEFNSKFVSWELMPPSQTSFVPFTFPGQRLMGAALNISAELNCGMYRSTSLVVTTFNASLNGAKVRCASGSTKYTSNFAVLNVTATV
ncbi:mucin-2-like [Physella acuta]|uniref:mucin-2-like n=1 Tax=Physella acuta TaxID=109671 RepID=UPI0027DC9CE7|nr:mucin-2-like [Physella acuta]